MSWIRVVAAAVLAAPFLVGQSPALYTFSRAGCAGTAGTPTSTSTGLPVPGQLLTMDVVDAPPNSAALLLLGLSRTQYAGGPLPLDLSVLGAAGCNLYVSVDASILVTIDASGRGSYPFVAPNGFQGFEFFTQWAVLDLAANGFGFTFSDHGSLVIGDSIWGVNLIANPGAEHDLGVPAGQDHAIQRWTDESGFLTSQLYNGFSVDDPSTGGANPGASFGNNYFYGGEAWTGSTESIYQSIALHNIASEIDNSKAQYDLSGSFGGWSGQDDVMTLYATFEDDAGVALASVQIGGVVSNAAARGNQSGYVFDTTQAVLPVGTRYVRLELECFKIAGGSYADGAADNLEFVLTLLP